MRIGGLQKTTLLDFPGKVAAVLFAQGCNFTCPYCHNPELTLPAGKGQKATLELADIMAFLQQRRGLLQGVVISGGEPTLQDDLPDFCATLKRLGYAVKLDTNGSRPAMLETLLRLKLVDYVAMDIKTGPKAYPKEFGGATAMGNITRSIEALSSSTLDYAPDGEAGEVSRVAYEFRVTCVAPFVDAKIFGAILASIPQQAPLFLQRARLEQVLDPAFFNKDGQALPMQKIQELADQALTLGFNCIIR